MGNRLKVSFIGIGVYKCGTTWTFNQLRAHPQICAPEKEMHFFDWDKYSLRQYKRVFDDCPMHKICGEWTPEYFTRPGVPERIKRLTPNVKLLTILRNPVDRAFSNWKSARYKNNIPKKLSFLQAFFKNHPVGGRPHSTLRKRGMYVKHLQRWFAVFPRKQIKVMLYDNLVADNLGFIQDIYKWLGVRSSFVPPKVDEKFCRDYNIKYENLKMTNTERRKVKNFYLPSIQNLENLLNLDLSKWKE